MDNQNVANQLISANKQLAFQDKEKQKRAEELAIAIKELHYQNSEKKKELKSCF